MTEDEIYVKINLPFVTFEREQDISELAKCNNILKDQSLRKYKLYLERTKVNEILFSYFYLHFNHI